MENDRWMFGTLGSSGPAMVLRAFVSTPAQMSIPLTFHGVVVDSCRMEDGILTFETEDNDTITYVPNVLWWTTDSE